MTIESEIATALAIKKTHMAQALKGDDYPSATEILYTYTSGKITQIDINYADTDFPDEVITIDYWDSGDGSVTINSVVYNYAAIIDGKVRQIIRTITGGDTITTSYGYDANGLLQRVGRTVV